MASIKDVAKQKLFATKSKVSLGSLSVGDAVLIALTVVRASAGKLYEMTKKTVGKKNCPSEDTFRNIVGKAVESRKGTIYAAFVSAIDNNNVFHPERFALSVKRLGVMDDIEDDFRNHGYESVALKLATYAPWFWGDVISREISTVKKEVSSPIRKVLSLFHEDITSVHIDELLEASLFGREPVTFRSQFLKSMSDLTVPTSVQPVFTIAARQISQSPVIHLPKESSFNAIFESFYQHLLTNCIAVKQIFSSSSFGGVKISPFVLQNIFRDKEVKRVFKYMFASAYDQFPSHTISLNRAMRAKTTYGAERLIMNASKKANVVLNPASVNAIISGVFSLFVIFQQDDRGQRFPVLKSTVE